VLARRGKHDSLLESIDMISALPEEPEVRFEKDEKAFGYFVSNSEKFRVATAVARVPSV